MAVPFVAWAGYVGVGALLTWLGCGSAEDDNEKNKLHKDTCKDTPKNVEKNLVKTEQPSSIRRGVRG